MPFWYANVWQEGQGAPPRPTGERLVVEALSLAEAEEDMSFEVARRGLAADKKYAQPVCHVWYTSRRDALAAGGRTLLPGEESPDDFFQPSELPDVYPMADEPEEDE